jgi:hypothetical protein
MVPAVREANKLYSPRREEPIAESCFSLLLQTSQHCGLQYFEGSSKEYPAYSPATVHRGKCFEVPLQASIEDPHYLWTSNCLTLCVIVD